MPLSTRPLRRSAARRLGSMRRPSLHVPPMLGAAPARLLTMLPGLGQRGEAALPALGRVIGARPRYIMHGLAGLMSMVLVGAIALQPRPVATTIAMQNIIEQEAAQAASASVGQDASRPEAAAEAVSAAVPGQAEASPAAAPQKPRVHTVQAGETLRMLAAKYSISTETILAANSISNPDVLKAGQELVILPTSGVLHVLQKGETLRQVAERYGVGVAELVGANDVGQNPDLVVEGTELVVPGAKPVVRAPVNAPVVQAEGEQRIASIPPVPVQERRAPSSRTYEVQPGDTLRGIAATFGVDVQTVLSSNGLDNADMLKPGVELRILPVKGIEYTVQPNETLADIAGRYQIDLGILLDYNDLDNPDVIRVGAKLVLPGATRRIDAPPPPIALPAAPLPAAPVVAVPAPRPQAAPAAPPVAQAPVPKPAAPVAAPKPVAPAPAPAPAAPAPAPEPEVAVPSGSGGDVIVANAMKFRGYPYVWGGTSPAGFDCSGFVFYVQKISGNPVGRGMFQQLNGGPRISREELLPGDIVFFANTYQPGLSHNGIYIGNNQFIHASDPSTGIVVSSMGSSYWAPRYVGATRLWQ